MLAHDPRKHARALPMMLAVGLVSFPAMASRTITQQVELRASDAVDLALFGKSVSLSGDTAVVGALCDTEAGTQAGAAY